MTGPKPPFMRAEAAVQAGTERVLPKGQSANPTGKA